MKRLSPLQLMLLATLFLAATGCTKDELVAPLSTKSAPGTDAPCVFPLEAVSDEATGEIRVPLTDQDPPCIFPFENVQDDAATNRTGVEEAIAPQD